MHVKKKVASRQAKPPFVMHPHQTGQKKDVLFSTYKYQSGRGGWCGGTLLTLVQVAVRVERWNGMEKQRSKQQVAVAIRPSGGRALAIEDCNSGLGHLHLDPDLLTSVA